MDYDMINTDRRLNFFTYVRATLIKNKFYSEPVINDICGNIGLNNLEIVDFSHNGEDCTGVQVKSDDPAVKRKDYDYIYSMISSAFIRVFRYNYPILMSMFTEGELQKILNGDNTLLFQVILTGDDSLQIIF